MSRHQFCDFSSKVDLYEIDTVDIDLIPEQGWEVVIITKGSQKSKRRFVAVAPASPMEVMALREKAVACREHVENYTRNRLFIAKWLPHVGTWAVSVATATGLAAWIKTKF